MPTKSVEINNSSYTKLDTTTESAIDMQNTSTATVRLIYSTSTPSKNSKACYSLKPKQGDFRGDKTGDMYAMVEGSESAVVVVGE